ncbi:MAG: 50S ribosomal protein L11 methyltransferase [Desulfohalobiaceae bacterium]|nr:50S ribosomal protein L11 methyltransferase [Desulfohalobiaceae bacterium]
MSRSLRPPEDLFIYYLQGRIPRHCFLQDTAFIGNWEEDGHAFLFFSRPALPSVQDIVSRFPQLTLKDSFQTTYEDWLGGPIGSFREDRLLIVPAWEEAPAHGPDDLLIRLNPGVVFGAGNHQTTRDCLQALSLVLTRDRGLRSALDLGTGSGLLSLGAVRLGLELVLALDLNPLAVSTCRQNIVLNQLQDQVLAVQGRAEDFIAAEADLILANIHFEVLQKLVRGSGFPEKKWFILSGLLRSQAREMRLILKEIGSQVVHIWDQDGTWFTLLGRN